MRRPLATVRARTALGASLALGIALLLSASTAGGLLRRSLIRSVDQVAQVRAADVATLASRGELPDGLSSQDGEIVQVVATGGRGLAASPRRAPAQPPAARRPPPRPVRAATVEQPGGGG